MAGYILNVQVSIDDKHVLKLLDKFTGTSVLKSVTHANYETGKILAKRMFNIWRTGWMAGPDRGKYVSQFRAIKNEYSATVDVVVPYQAFYMDVMQRPRFFSINGKPRMKRWLNQNFGFTRRGYSRVHFEKGKAKYGRLYVNPSHFSERAIREIRREHKYYLGQVIKNVIKGGI